MTAITLPETRAIKIDKPRLLDWGGRLVPPLGGPVQTLNRLGTRWAIDVSIPLMRTEPDGRTWGAALAQAKINGVLMWFRQDGLVIGSPGTPVVDGASQRGSQLAMVGFNPGYGLRNGQFFSIVTGGRRYLHMVVQDVAADGTSRSAPYIFPMLRVSPTSGATCEFVKPYIQGSLIGNEAAWTRLTAPWTDLGTISIVEDE